MTKLHAEGIGTVCSRLYIGTAKNIPPSELIDTTGAGDAFIGAVLYGGHLFLVAFKGTHINFIVTILANSFTF